MLINIYFKYTQIYTVSFGGTSESSKRKTWSKCLISQPLAYQFMLRFIFIN